MRRLQAVRPQEIIPRSFQMFGDQQLRGVGIDVCQVALADIADMSMSIAFGCTKAIKHSVGCFD